MFNVCCVLCSPNYKHGIQYQIVGKVARISTGLLSCRSGCWLTKFLSQSTVTIRTNSTERSAEGTLPCSQRPTTVPCTLPDASSPHLPTPLHYNFTRCFILVWNLVSHTEVRIKVQGVWKQCAEQIVWKCQEAGEDCIMRSFTKYC
jgi:hypothetical protein